MQKKSDGHASLLQSSKVPPSHGVLKKCKHILRIRLENRILFRRRGKFSGNWKIFQHRTRSYSLYVGVFFPTNVWKQVIQCLRCLLLTAGVSNLHRHIVMWSITTFLPFAKMGVGVSSVWFIRPAGHKFDTLALQWVYLLYVTITYRVFFEFWIFALEGRI